MSENEALRHWLIALRTPGLRAADLRRAWLESAGCIQTTLTWLHRRAAGNEAARAWLAQPDERLLAQDQNWLAIPGHRLWCCTEADFPPLLENMSQPPPALFVAGDATLLLQPQVAIVGARKASQTGQAIAGDFASALARAGFVVTSGMAEGIDGAAHAATLKAGGATIAVVGTGPDRVYPRRHHALAQQIVTHGALVSEFPPGTAALPHHFPRRNRIIAGLTLGTLVIEANLQSGSLITARQAGEQGREVFTIPGSIRDPQMRGCHQLIRDGAHLVETPAEVIDVLTPLARELGAELARKMNEPVVTDDPATPYWRQDRDYQALLAALEYHPAPLDVLCQRTGQTAATLSSMLLMLELDGMIENLPGNRYQRLAR